MKKLIYKWAKSFIEKHDNKRKEKTGLARVETQMKLDKLISEFSQKYHEEVINKFKETVKPKFQICEFVTTNWYGPGRGWDGSMSMLQAHTPFKGPIDVEILTVLLDSCEISEIIYELKNRGEFDNKYTDISYSSFKRIVDGHRRKFDISWAYMIKVPGDDHQYWKYSIRENKFLKLKSDEAKWSKKAYKNQIESNRLYEERKALEEKIKIQIEKANHIKVITYGK